MYTRALSESYQHFTRKLRVHSYFPMYVVPKAAASPAYLWF